jgi:hypothetical protein
MTTVRNPDATPAEPPGQARPRLAPTPVRVTPETELTLLLDVGSAWTKAALVGRAGGRWRIVSGTAQPTAWGESVLVEDLVGRLTPHADARLSRRLANLVREAPRITCRSPRRAGRLAVVTDTTAALEGATAVAIRSGWTVEAGLAADDRGSDADRFTLLRGAEVDAWLAVPSGRHGDRLWGLMAGARGPSSSPVLVVAAEDQVDRFVALFGTGTRVVSSSVDDRLAEALFDRLTTMNGLGEPRSATPVAFGRAMEALARGLGVTVLGVDAGASWLAWHHATGRGTDRTAVLAATPDQPLPIGSRAAAEILPADVDEFTTTDAMASLAARRSAIPASPVEAAIAQAIGVDRLAALVPLEPRTTANIIRKVNDSVVANVNGVLAVGAAQGLALSVGFWLVGVRSPVLWGVLGGLASVIPVVGSPLVWVPVVVGFIVLGSYWKALILGLWSALLVGSIDNLLRPIVVGAREKQHPIIIALAAIGGTYAFGTLGILLGPVVVSLIAALVEEIQKLNPLSALTASEEVQAPVKTVGT